MRRNILLALTILLVAAAIIVRLHNHSSAVAQANAIVAADQTGSATSAPIAALKHYTATHTYANVTFGLTGSYARAQAAAAAAAQSGTTGQVYAAAQAACAGHADSIAQANCVQAYLAAHATAQPNPSPVATPDPASYSYHFRSPVVALDASTGLLAAALISFAAALIIGKRRS